MEGLTWWLLALGAGLAVVAASPSTSPSDESSWELGVAVETETLNGTHMAEVEYVAHVIVMPIVLSIGQFLTVSSLS